MSESVGRPVKSKKSMSKESQPATEDEPSSSRQTRSSSSRLLPPSPQVIDAFENPPQKPPISGGPPTEDEPSSSRQTRSSSSRLLPPSPQAIDPLENPPQKPPISGGPPSKTPPTQEKRITRSSSSFPAVAPSESSTPESTSTSTKRSGLFSKKSPSPEGGSKPHVHSWTSSPAKKAREKLSQAMERLKGKSPSKSEQGEELVELSSLSDVTRSPSKRKPKPELIASKLSTPEKRRKESGGEQSGTQKSRTPEPSITEQCQASLREIAALPSSSSSAPVIKISDTRKGARYLLPTQSGPSVSSDSRDELSRSEARPPMPRGTPGIQVTPDFLADVLTNLAESLRKASPHLQAGAEQDENMFEFRERGNGDYYLLETKEAQTDTKLRQFFNQMKQKIRSAARRVRRRSRGDSLRSAAKEAGSSRPPSREQEAVDEPIIVENVPEVEEGPVAETQSRGTQTVSLEIRDYHDRVLYCVALSFRNLDLCFGGEEWSIDDDSSSYSSEMTSSISDLRNIPTRLTVPSRSRSRSNSPSTDVSMETVTEDDDSRGATDASKAGTSAAEMEVVVSEEDSRGSVDPSRAGASVAQKDVVGSEEDSRGSVDLSRAGTSAAQQDVVASEEDSRSSGVSSLATSTAKLEVRSTRRSSRDKSKFDLS